MAKAVKVIPVKPVRMVDGLAHNAKKRACAYCRVSTDSKEQENSYESQIAIIPITSREETIGHMLMCMPMKEFPVQAPKTEMNSLG